MGFASTPWELTASYGIAQELIRSGASADATTLAQGSVPDADVAIIVFGPTMVKPAF
jgi:hypothetical protein